MPDPTPTVTEVPPAPAPEPEPVESGDEQVSVELLVEDVSIDGMCGVY